MWQEGVDGSCLHPKINFENIDFFHGPSGTHHPGVKDECVFAPLWIAVAHGKNSFFSGRCRWNLRDLRSPVWNMGRSLRPSLPC